MNALLKADNETIKDSARVKKGGYLYAERAVLFLTENPDPDILFSMTDELGLNVIEVNSPEKAAEILSSDFQGICLADASFLAGRGKSIAEIICEKRMQNYFVISVPVHEGEIVFKYLGMGFSSFVKNPFDYRHFNSVMRAVLDARKSFFDEKEVHDAAGQFLRKKIEWLNYKSMKNSLGQDAESKKIIEHLRESLLQAGGFGALLSIADAIVNVSEKTETGFHVSGEFMNMLKENTALAMKQVDGLTESIGVFSREFPLKEVPFSEAVQIVKSVSGECQKNLTRLGHKIHPAECRVNSSKNLPISREALRLALEELIINAAKYSVPGSPIHVYTTISEGYLCVSVKNENLSFESKLPENAADFLSKPFFRLHPPKEEIIETEKFAMGLGLTAVSFLMSKMNGLFQLSVKNDHTDLHSGIKECVISQLFLPIE